MCYTIDEGPPIDSLVWRCSIQGCADVECCMHAPYRDMLPTPTWS